MSSIVLKIEGELPAEQLEGKLFQVHVLPDNRIRLYTVDIEHDSRCPVIVGGERCGLRAGHEGKHYWANGD